MPASACGSLWRVLLSACLLFILTFFGIQVILRSCASFFCNPKLVWLAGSPPSSAALLESEFSSVFKDNLSCVVANPPFSTELEDQIVSIPQAGHGKSFSDRPALSDHDQQSEELGNGTFWAGVRCGMSSNPCTNQTFTAQNNSDDSKKKLEWFSPLDPVLLSAKHTIENGEVVVNGGGALYSPIYHNLTTFIKSYDLMEKTFKIFIYTEGTRPFVHTGPITGIYASEGRFIHQLELSKNFVVKDPNSAHMFFLPYSVANMVEQLYVPDSHTMLPITTFITEYVSSVASKYPFWNNSRGADHFFVSCHDWGPFTARGHAELRQNSVKVVCNADVNEEFIVGKDVSLMETYLHTAKPPTKLGGPPPSKRPFLAFFAGHMHGSVRPKLIAAWKDKDPSMRIFEMLPASLGKKMSYIRHLKVSKFCICPRGFEVNSPRIVEAIYYDCVPVIMADGFVLPFSDVLNWEAFAVVVGENEVPRLRDILRAVPEERYLVMQANLKHVRQHFMWHKAPEKYDAFHMILYSLWMRRLALVHD